MNINEAFKRIIETGEKKEEKEEKENKENVDEGNDTIKSDAKSSVDAIDLEEIGQKFNVYDTLAKQLSNIHKEHSKALNDIRTQKIAVMKELLKHIEK